jgi:hypothetical protein
MNEEIKNILIKTWELNVKLKICDYIIKNIENFNLNDFSLFIEKI